MDPIRISSNESLSVYVADTATIITLSTGATCITKRAADTLHRVIYKQRYDNPNLDVILHINATFKLKKCELTVDPYKLSISGATRLTKLSTSRICDVSLASADSLHTFTSLDNSITNLAIQRSRGAAPTWPKLCETREMRLNGDFSSLALLRLTRIRLASDFVWPLSVEIIFFTTVSCPPHLDLRQLDLFSLYVVECHDLRRLDIELCRFITLSNNGRLCQVEADPTRTRHEFNVIDCFCIPLGPSFFQQSRPCAYWQPLLKQLSVTQRYVKTRKLRRFVELITSEEFNQLMFQPDQLGGRLAKKALEQQMDCS